MYSIPGVIIIDGHVQGLSNTRSLGEKGVPVWVCDTNRSVATYSKFCLGYSVCPDYNSDDLVLHLIELSQKNDLVGWLLLPSNDHAVRTISRNKIELEKTFKILTSKLNLIDLIQDKEKLLLFASQYSIPIPKLYSIDTLRNESVEKIQYPIIVRGKEGLNFYKLLKQKIFRVNNREDLMKVGDLISSKKNGNGFLIQEMIPYNPKNTTISFCAFCSEGKILTFWIGRKLGEHPIPFGTATSAVSIYNEEVRQMGTKLIDKLGYTGVCEVEFLWNSNKKEYQLIEMNARTWLWVGLAKRCGIDFSFLTYQFVNNEKVEFPINYEDKIFWYNPITHFSMIFFLIFKGKFRFLSVFHIPLFSKKDNALFSWRDMKPGFVYLLNIFKFLKNR